MTKIPDQAFSWLRPVMGYRWVGKGTERLTCVYNVEESVIIGLEERAT